MITDPDTFTTILEILINNKLREIGQELKTQGNRITSDPIFLVQEKRRIWGMDSDYSDKYVWVNEDGYELELEQEEFTDLEMGDVPAGYSEVNYEDIWVTVQPFFTEKAANNYIAENSHRLNQPRTYVISGYRNSEWQDVRNYLKEL